jgi:hypothetical protein
LGNAKDGYITGVDMSGNIIWSDSNYVYHTGISPYIGYGSGVVFPGVQFNGTFGNGNYTDEFIVSDELKIEHMDIETGEIEFKRNPNYINIKFNTIYDDIYILPKDYNASYINIPAILKADFS